VSAEKIEASPDIIQHFIKTLDTINIDCC